VISSPVRLSRRVRYRPASETTVIGSVIGCASAYLCRSVISTPLMLTALRAAWPAARRTPQVWARCAGLV